MIESKSLLTVGEKAPHYAEILKKTWHATSHNSAGYWMAEGLLQGILEIDMRSSAQ